MIRGKKSLALLLCLVLLSGCAPSDSARPDTGEAETEAGDGEGKVLDDYDVKSMDLKQEEKDPTAEYCIFCST